MDECYAKGVEDEEVECMPSHVSMQILFYTPPSVLPPTRFYSPATFGIVVIVMKGKAASFTVHKPLPSVSSQTHSD